MGEHLPPARLTALAAQAGVAPRTVQSLPVRKALRLAAETDDIQAVALLQELMSSPEKVVQPEQPRSLRRRLIRWVIKLFV